MSGNCLFYDITDNRLQLAAQICLQGKKKLPGRRITGFEFSPSDASKLIVTSADSLVRVICGLDVICKFRASSLRANQTSASFTSDGKHIISTSEDSSVYIWNYTGQERTFRTKNIQSCESFLSQNASVAIPWRGIETIPETLSSPETSGDVNSFQSDRSCPKFCGELEQKKALLFFSLSLFLSCPWISVGVFDKGIRDLARGETSQLKSEGSLTYKIQTRVQVFEKCLSEYVKFSLVGSCYCNCRLGRADQNIPQLRFTSSIVKKTNQGFNERYKLGYFHGEKG
ncbi:hypothetical protein OIU78_009716 [Salix suchowensis]|nr:hypothetical protein OIU78_009716 [Salix suchowensis]